MNNSPYLKYKYWEYAKPELHGDVLPVLEGSTIDLASEISSGKQIRWPPHHIHHEQFVTAARK